jgi:hypothetical protein
MEFFNGEIANAILTFIDKYKIDLSELTTKDVYTSLFIVANMYLVHIIIRGFNRHAAQVTEHNNKMLDIKEDERSTMVEFLVDFAHRISEIEEKPDRTDEVMKYLQTMHLHNNNILNGITAICKSMDTWIDVINDGRRDHNEHVNHLFEQFKTHSDSIQGLTLAIQHRPDPVQSHELKSAVTKLTSKIDNIKIEIPGGDNINTLVELSKHYEGLIGKFNDILQVTIEKQTVELKEQLPLLPLLEEFEALRANVRDTISAKMGLLKTDVRETITSRLDFNTGMLVKLIKTELSKIPEQQVLQLDSVDNLAIDTEKILTKIDDLNHIFLPEITEVGKILSGEIAHNNQAILDSQLSVIDLIGNISDEIVKSVNINKTLLIQHNKEISDIDHDKNIALQEEVIGLINDLDDSICETLNKSLSNLEDILDKEPVDLKNAISDIEDVVELESKNTRQLIINSDADRKENYNNNLLHLSELKNSVEEHTVEVEKKIDNISFPAINFSEVLDHNDKIKEGLENKIGEVQHMVQTINSDVVLSELSSVKEDIINNIPEVNFDNVINIMIEYNSNINNKLGEIEKNVKEYNTEVYRETLEQLSAVRNSINSNIDDILNILNSLTINQSLDNIETLIGTDVANMHHEIILFLEQLKERLSNA